MQTEEAFKNEVQAMGGLPSIEPEDFEPLPLRYKKLRWGIFFMVLMVFLMGMIGPLLWFFFSEGNWNWGLAGSSALLLLVFLIWGIEEHRGFSIRGVLLRQKDLTYRSGYWSHDVVTVPFNRIQHSEISQGPVARWFNVCTLKLYTAGSSGANLQVPGMDVQRAHQIRTLLNARIGEE